MIKMFLNTIDRFIRIRLIIFLFYFFRLWPLKNKIVATTMRGRKYGDNPQYILEELRKLRPDLDFVWLRNLLYDFDIPDWIREVPYYTLVKKVYELATAKVWINTHRIEHYIRKRKGQLFIETWHGGLGMKKIEMDTEVVRNSKEEMAELENTCKLADVFISNSEHLSKIYRRAFGYKGPIYKCGYPKNDVLLSDNQIERERVMKYLGVAPNTHLCMYAPTFRDVFEKEGTVNLDLYNIDFTSLEQTLRQKFGGDWKILVRWHPLMRNYIKEKGVSFTSTIDVTEYENMQDLICSVDLMISDYSSCIFDAAIREIPCFTFTKDFEEYKSERGVYFEMEDLPFPNSRDNEELLKKIIGFDKDKYLLSFKEFETRVGLNETGHSAKDIAEKITGYINGEAIVWN